LNDKYSIPILDKCQRGTSPELRWLVGRKESNIEASPPLIAKHELKVKFFDIKEPVPVYREGTKGGLRNTIYFRNIQQFPNFKQKI
jgi:hypothetical protein